MESLCQQEIYLLILVELQNERGPIVVILGCILELDVTGALQDAVFQLGCLAIGVMSEECAGRHLDT